jgi:hypothetical protein
VLDEVCRDEIDSLWVSHERFERGPLRLEVLSLRVSSSPSGARQSV